MLRVVSALQAVGTGSSLIASPGTGLRIVIWGMNISPASGTTAAQINATVLGSAVPVLSAAATEATMPVNAKPLVECDAATAVTTTIAGATTGVTVFYTVKPA